MFKVESWSAFRNAWVEYVAPTWGARAVRHKTEDEALDRMTRIARDWPRDKFRVSEA